MNKIGKIVGCLLLLVPVGVVGQKPQKVSDHLKTIEVNYVGVDELRTLQYKPDGQDSVCIMVIIDILVHFTEVPQRIALRQVIVLSL